MAIDEKQDWRVYVLPKLVALWFVLALLLPSDALALSPTTPLTNFPTEAQAQQHCSADTVVWLNLPTGILSREGPTLVRPNQERSLRVPQRSERSRNARKPEWAMSRAGHSDRIGGHRRHVLLSHWVPLETGREAGFGAHNG
jgi:hypothetical protein